MSQKSDYENWTKEELIDEVKILKKQKTYGLVWEKDKTKEVFDCYINWDGVQTKENFGEEEGKFPVLKEVKTKSIDNKDTKYNLIIEGDNYHALAVLNFTHNKAIDIIYIDPPYNTGSKDWKYNNNYVDKEDTYRHSKWLSFMEKRLRLAKNLLKKDGVLICTIDENEHATLGLLLQEIFFDREIVGIVIIHNPAGVQGKNFSYTHEFAYFVYPKNGTFIGKTTRDKDLVSPLRDWGGTSARKLAKTCFYPIIIKNDQIIGFGEVCKEDFHPKAANIPQKDGSIYVYPIDKHGTEKKWVFSRSSAQENIDNLFVKKIDNEYVIIRKKDQFTYRTVWDDKKYYANIYGSKLLNNIISTKFPFPKSLYAVEDCIKAVIHNKNHATILDFFAGSGTTGHAVLELNKEDKGNRKFILCTNNENNICEEVTYPRIKKVIQGYTGINDKKTYEGLDSNLKYFKTDFVESAATDTNKRKIVEKSTEMLCIKENAFHPIKDKKGYKIFKNTDIHLGIIFDEDEIKDFVRDAKEIKGKFHVYVFSFDDTVPKEEFEELKGKVKLCPIPEVILHVYRRIFR